MVELTYIIFAYNDGRLILQGFDRAWCEDACDGADVPPELGRQISGPYLCTETCQPPMGCSMIVLSFD